MRKGVIGVLIAGGVLTLAGAIVFGIGSAKEVKEEQLITHTYELELPLSNFDIDIETADLEFKPATDGKGLVVVEEKEKEYHTVIQEENTLFIDNIVTRKWYENLLSFASKKMKITIYLPTENITYNKLSITTSTGDITIPKEFMFENTSIELSTGDVNFSASSGTGLTIQASTGDLTVSDGEAGSLSLSTTTGKISVSNYNAPEVEMSTSTGGLRIEHLRCNNINLGTTTGKVKLNDVISKEKLSILTSTGDIDIVDSDAGEVYMNAGTGDIDAIFLTDKIIVATSRTGHINVPHLANGGPCNVETSTGDINISIKG